MRTILILLMLMATSSCAILDRIGAGCLADVRDAVVDYIDDDISLDELTSVVESCAAELSNVALVQDQAALAAHAELHNPLAVLSLLTPAERVQRAERVLQLLQGL